MNLNWTQAAMSITKCQLGLMLALIGSSVALSPAQAGLDEKREVLAEWLVNFTIEALPDLTAAPQRATMPKTVEWLDALAIAPADPADWTPIRAVPGVLIKGTFKGDDQARFLLRLPKDWNGKLVVAGASGTRSEFNGDLVISDYVLQKGYAYASQTKGRLTPSQQMRITRTPVRRSLSQMFPLGPPTIRCSTSTFWTVGIR